MIMTDTVIIDQKDALPEVSLAEDPCVHRLVHTITTQLPETLNVSVIPYVREDIETYKLHIAFNKSLTSAEKLRFHIRQIGSNILQCNKHAYWAIYCRLSFLQRRDLLHSLISIPGVQFATIDTHGFLCVEYAAKIEKIEFCLNQYLDEFFKTIILERGSHERASPP